MTHQNNNEESGRYSPLKSTMPMPGYKQSFEENKVGVTKLKVSKPIQKISQVKISRNVDPLN